MGYRMFAGIVTAVVTGYSLRKFGWGPGLLIGLALLVGFSYLH